MWQAMTKIIYIPQFQNLTLLSYKTQHCKLKTLRQLTPNTAQKYVSAIIVQPNLPSLTHSPQIIPFYDTSFFKYKNYFQGFFLPDDYSLDITTLQQQQSQDQVLRTVYSWIIKNDKPETLTPLITGTPFLHAYYKRFTQLFIDDSTNPISLYTKHSTTLNQSSTPNFVRATIRICLPFRLFKTVFNKLHEHSHTGIKITYNTFTQYYYIPFVEKWLSIFIHDCIECQRKKNFNMKIQTAPTQSFSEHASSFNYRNSMDTKGPINPPSHNKSYIQVIIDAFSHFVVTVPIKSNNAKTAIKTLLHHWIIKFGPPIYLVSHRGSEYVNKEMAHLCTLMGIRHSPRTAYSPWTNGLVEVQNRNLGKINSHAYITKTYHEGKPLPIGTFVLKRNFTHVLFSDKLKPLRIGPYKIIDSLSDVTYELLAQNGSTIYVHRYHLIPYYPKNHSYIHICVVSCAFQTQLNSKFHNLPNMQTVILPL